MAREQQIEKVCKCGVDWTETYLMLEKVFHSNEYGNFPSSWFAPEPTPQAEAWPHDAVGLGAL